MRGRYINANFWLGANFACLSLGIVDGYHWLVLLANASATVLMVHAVRSGR